MNLESIKFISSEILQDSYEDSYKSYVNETYKEYNDRNNVILAGNILTYIDTNF
ncbi:hypothetical protein SAMN02745196_02321 [Clostridium collagenovorans DSM 3089]|uniref:Uncharacterized protein n=1 Tax=Clostridium collagenovorans DSM 3089 TaxID=1121306 RepID=A0A1M5XNB9_9CLOT|nr:hypothetical protein SAMN02745196_02321 [Clostridium collagenovorans DSM 3089]